MNPLPSDHSVVSPSWPYRLVRAAGLLFFLAWFGSTATAQPQTPPVPDRLVDDPTEIVLLGTGHFAGSAGDEYSSTADDILTDRRQRELDAVADRIAEYGPDQFFAECVPDDQPGIDSLYQAYRAGSYAPTPEEDRNEIRQLGFRAADRSGLAGVECVDARGLWLADRAHAVAREHSPDLLKELRQYGKKMSSVGPRIREQSTIGEWLRALNTDSLLFANHNAYVSYYARIGSFDESGLQLHSELEGQTIAFAGTFEGVPVQRGKEIARDIGARVVDTIGPDTDYVVLGAEPGSAPERAERVGAQTMTFPEVRKMIMEEKDLYVGFPDHHIGADLVGEWYKRNLRIYANIWRAVQPGSDRVLLLMGQGHIWTLRQFFRENPRFEVVPVADVL